MLFYFFLFEMRDDKHGLLLLASLMSDGLQKKSGNVNMVRTRLLGYIRSGDVTLDDVILLI